MSNCSDHYIMPKDIPEKDLQDAFDKAFTFGISKSIEKYMKAILMDKGYSPTHESIFTYVDHKLSKIWV